MRKALFTELKKLYPVYNIGGSSATTAKPYLMLKFGTEINTSLGRYTIFSVICFADASNSSQLDAMYEAVVKALNKKRIARVSDLTVFCPEYNGAGPDFPDDVLKALSKEVQFKVPSFGTDIM